MANKQVLDVTEVKHEPTLEERAANAAAPASNPLPGSTFVVTPGEPSRLPAGSTLEVAPGLHVPHPHAEVNLPGVADPRVGETAAVTETLAGEQRPLAEEVRPKTLTVVEGSQEVKHTITGEPSGPHAARAADIKVVIDGDVPPVPATDAKQ